MNELLEKTLDLYEKHWEPCCGNRSDIEEGLVFGEFLFSRLIYWHHHTFTCSGLGLTEFHKVVQQWCRATKQALQIGNGVDGSSQAWPRLRDCFDKGLLMLESLDQQVEATQHFRETRRGLINEMNQKVEQKFEELE